MQAADILDQDRLTWLDRLADSAQVGLYVLSMRAEQPVCEYANQTWRTWTGVHDSTQTAWLAGFHPEDRLRMQQLYLKVLLTGTSEKTEYRLLGPRQDILYAADTVCPLWDDAAGETIGLCGTVQDISLLKSAREEMQRTQLLQSLGGLMAGIAHEMNTPLQFIGDNIQFIADAWTVLSAQQAQILEAVSRLSQTSTPEAISQVLQTIDLSQRQSGAEFMAAEFPKAVSQSLEGIERLIQLVSAMRDFSHLDERRQAPADLNRAVRSAVTLLQNELKYACDIELQLDPNLPEISCSIDEINRVLLNLLTNAVHSISEKIERGAYSRGRIRVTTSRAEHSITIAIEDNGTGIAPEVRDRVFERYFTTKRNHPERRGTGQGLAMAYETIVDHHQGTLTFETAVGQGTTFHVVLPFQAHLGEQNLNE
jgi:signal transduction histidine kinase